MAKIKKTGRHTGAIKAWRQSLRRRTRNNSKRLKIKLLVKNITSLSAAKDKNGAEKKFREYTGAVDKAVKTGVLHWRTAARRKSRWAKTVNQTAVAV